jgi:hypothetical protein
VLASSDVEEQAYPTPERARGRIELRAVGHLSCFRLPTKK